MKKFFFSLMAFLFASVFYAVASAAVALGVNTNPLMLAGVNTIDSDLQLDVILESALEAFRNILTPLATFSTVFKDVRLKGTNKIQIPYYPLEAAASRDFNGTYLFDDTDTQSIELEITKRKYQSLAFTSEEWNRQPQFDPERLGTLKGQKLAEDVLRDIFSLVTVANYGAAIFTGAASTFDRDTITDIEVAVEEANWPTNMRSIILKPAYLGNVKKDMNASGGMATFNRDVNGSMRTFPTLDSFTIAVTNVIPTNGENLVGMVVYPSAILIGFAPITPAPAVMKRLASYRIQSDDDLGISLEYREWGDADTDTEKRTIEVNYGRAVGQAAALRAIRSAAP